MCNLFGICKAPLLALPVLHPGTTERILFVMQDIFRVFDSLNYLDNLKFGLDAVMDAGGIAEGTICYTGDISDPRKMKVQHFHSLSAAVA